MTNTNAKKNPTENRFLSEWVDEVVRLTRPDQVYWCDGSEAERQRLYKQAVADGVLIPLNPKKRPGCYLHRSNPNDVARSEDLTFICTRNKEDAGPTNNWMAPAETYERMRGWFDGAMRGRTMYVVPYVMGPLDSPFSRVGVELTDSIYVALNMGLMTRMGTAALQMLGASNDFNRGLHSTLDCDPKRRLVCHFPEDNTIWSAGSGYGGNALLSKKCFALRIASWLGRTDGWLAEHMLILGLQSPAGRDLVHRSGLSERVRQDQSLDAYAAAGISRLARDHRRRRHRVDASRSGRPPVGGQSRGRILWRRARNQRTLQSERDEDGRARHHLHQRRNDP